MKSYRYVRYPSPSRCSSLFIRLRERLASSLDARRRKPPHAAWRRRRPLSVRLADGCRCLFARLNRRSIRTAGKMVIAFTVAMGVWMILGNSLKQSFTTESQQLSVEKRSYESEHTVMQARLKNLVQEHQEELGLGDRKPEQYVFMRMN